MPKIQVVSCDVHGTLILPQPSVGEIYASYAQGHGYQVEAAAIGAQFKPGFMKARRECQLAYGKTQADARHFWHQVIRYTFLLAHNLQVSEAFCDDLFYGFGKGEHWYVLDNVHEMLAFVQSQKIPLVVCSNFDERVRGILADLKLDVYFERMFISAEMGMAKPDTRIMETICETMKCSAAEVLHIGNHKREDGEFCTESGAHWFQVDEQGRVPMNLEKFKSMFEPRS